MSSIPEKGFKALRRGRISVIQARYFLTIVTDKRKTGLDCSLMYDSMLDEIEQNPAETLSFILMPDHLHWLICLDCDESLSQVVKLLKGRLSVALRTLGLAWQRGAYHDRRCRFEDDLEPFLRYILCNPYRRGLCRINQRWPYTYFSPGISSWFIPMLNKGCPFVQWVQEANLLPWEADIET